MKLRFYSKTVCVPNAADLRIRVKILWALLLAVAMAGCSSVVGTPIQKEKVAQIRLGATTEPDLLLLFGNPATKTLDPSGAMVLTWAYSTASTKPQTFVP